MATLVQDDFVEFDWSNKADDTPVSLALMATNSEMEFDLTLGHLKLEEKQKELDQVLKERDDFKVKLEKWTNAAVLQNEVLNKQRYLSDKSCIGFGVESSSSKESDNSSGNTNSTESLYPNFQKAKGFHAVPPPTGTIIPPRENVTFTGIDELAIRNKVVNQENTKSSQLKIDRNKVIIEDWVDSDDEETALNFSEIQKKTVLNSENSETSFENRSPNSQNSVGQGSRKKGLGHKGGKTCFGNPEEDLKDYAIIDSGCSGSMTGDKDKLSDFKEFKGGYTFEKVSYVEELKFNLLSVSQICDKKHNVLFTDKECLILSPKFKFVDEDLVILRAPRKNDVYSLDLKNIIPSGGELAIWLRFTFRKDIQLDQLGLACRKGKQHRASCKKIEERTVREPLELLHMDLFGPVSVESVNRKKYCLVVTDDCSKFIQEGYLLGYSTSSKGFRVYNRVTRKVQDCLHVDFLEDQKNQKGKGDDGERLEPAFLFMSKLESTQNKHSEELLLTKKFHWSSEDKLYMMLFTGNTPTDNKEDGAPDYNNMDHTIDVSSTLHFEFIRIILRVRLLAKVLLGYGKRVIGTKWVFRNKRDERGTIIKNKARLVAQGYRQEEGVDYDEVFAPVARN
ncbi:ribonuclease H-like domain-containing protein [Tanacetum coccineum]|uniref:Ribonuclease H-like domain-containing protein n=1 Tax=Tanacetum coccineum TaxID=301880 RepID=A0ABQ5ARI6_9ASTR